VRRDGLTASSTSTCLRQHCGCEARCRAAARRVSLWSARDARRPALC